MAFAMLFPGQGSQSLGMLAELSNEFPQVAETFAEASDALGYDLWKLCQHGPESELNLTRHTQPAMLVAGVACARVWSAAGGPSPAVVTGHSLGEYSALVVAGSIEFADAAALVGLRGELMQAAMPGDKGAMAAIIGMDNAAIEALCAELAAEEVVEPVNYNAPGQVVIAGHRAAVERVVAAAPEQGAKLCKVLAVSVPAHSSLMQPAAEKLAERLADIDIKSPQIPVLHNVDATSHQDVAEIRRLLALQVHSPVQWVNCVEKLTHFDADSAVEIGPGKVLSGLVKRINRRFPVAPVYSPETLEKALAAFI